MIAVDPDNAEWYTPQEILDRVYNTLGQIDLDPCSNRFGNPVVKAKQHYTLPTNGLQEQWEGTVYVNPPYGRQIGKWVDKFMSEYRAGRIKNAILLVPVKTDTQWWQDLSSVMACWCAIQGRLKFSSPSGTHQTGTFASALILVTDSFQTQRDFVYQLAHIGHIWSRTCWGKA